MSTKPAGLTVLFWNVNLDPENSTELSDSEDITAVIGAYIATYQVDLIILAEATRDYAFKLLVKLSETDDWDLLQIDNYKNKEVSRAGVVLFRKHIHIFDVGSIKITSTPGNTVPRGRVIYLDEFKLILACIHLKSKGKTKEGQIPNESSRVYDVISKAIRERHERKKTACIIMGDFNQHPYESDLAKQFEKQYEVSPVRENNGYYHPFAALWGDGEHQIKGTYCLKLSPKAKKNKRPTWWMYDYALFSPQAASQLDLKFLKSYPAIANAHLQEKSVAPSDHAPVLFRLKTQAR